jgi:hypothetical protein
VPEELVNSASAFPAFQPGFKRSRTNQPAPAFPQSPGIILKTNSFNLSTATARLVLSMNRGHPSRFLKGDNELICTACSQKRAGETTVNNAIEPMKSMPSSILEHELFTTF